jgi:hypothetical protein
MRTYDISVSHPMPQGRGLYLHSTATQEPRAALLRLHRATLQWEGTPCAGATDKSPVLSYRGPEDLQERIVSYVRCLYSWPWLALKSSHQQPCDATAGGNVSPLSLCPVRTTAGSARISQQGVFGSIHLFSHRDSKPEMPRCPCPR